MSIREPTVAGTFYPDARSACQKELDAYFDAARRTAPRLGRVVGGIVPHAGWVCSGAVAAKVFVAFQPHPPQTVVIFGAVHYLMDEEAAIFGDGAWRTPLGEVQIDGELADAVVARSDLLVADERSHSPEHSIEVQVPFVRRLLPEAKLLPILVPPGRHSHEVGKAVADAVAAVGRPVVYVGSTDLTHYGPRYGFTPEGVGERGVEWAKKVNDRRMLDLVVAMRSEAVVEESRTHHNACGSGAIAAAIAACRTAGAERVVLLEHTNSAETLAHVYPGESSDAVGYAAVVFTKTQM